MNKYIDSGLYYWYTKSILKRGGNRVTKVAIILGIIATALTIIEKSMTIIEKVKKPKINATDRQDESQDVNKRQ